MLQLVLRSVYHFYEITFSGALSRTQRFFGNFKTNSEKQPIFFLKNSEKCYKSLKLFHTLFFNINSLRHNKLRP